MKSFSMKLLRLAILVMAGCFINACGNLNATREEKKMEKEPINNLEDLNATPLTLLDESAQGISDRVLQLLKAGANANAKDVNERTALMKASARNLPEVVKLLIAAEVDVNSQDKEKKTALYLAVENGHTAIVKLLLAAEAKEMPHEDLSALAKQKGHKDIWRLLIQGEFPPMIEREGVFNTPKEMDEYLLGRANSEDQFGMTLLLWAIRENDIAEVKTLIAEGANVNFVNQFYQSTLMVATMKNRPEIVKLLIQAGADVNYRNYFGKSILQVAEQKGLAEIADLLKSAGAKE